MVRSEIYKGLLALILALAVWLAGRALPLAAQGPDTSFTFQGRLRLTGGVYVTGQACDFQFSLWSAPAGASGQLGPTLDRPNSLVQDGYFSADLDFGSVFDGNQRFLEIGVRCPAGGSGPYTALGERARLDAIPYALYGLNYGSAGAPWTKVTGKPAGFADDVDNVLTYTNGYGLGLANNQFSVIPETVINDTTLQRRILGGCPPGQTIQQVNGDGTVACRDGDVTYSAGTGLRMDRIDPFGRPILEPNFDYVQERVDSLLCGPSGSGEGIRRVLPTGEVECESIPGGDITAVLAGPGLSGGGFSGVVTLTVATGGITSTYLAGVSSPERLADGAVTTARLAPNAVTSAEIANGGIQLVDIGRNGCLDNQLMVYTPAGWACADDTPGILTAGPGIALNGLVFSAKVKAGLAIAGGRIVADFPAANSATATGNAGSASTVSRSDHTHDGTYIKPTDVISGDVTGSFSAGFTVTGLQGTGVSGSPQNNDILQYNGTDWVPIQYGFPFTLTVQEFSATGENKAKGQTWASCPDTNNWVLVGGGCRCLGNDQLEDSYPSGPATWYCDCNNGLGIGDNAAYARCLKNSYP